MKHQNEIVKIDGYTFKLGFSAFTINRNSKFYGALLVNDNCRDLGYKTGLEATEAEIAAIKKAREYVAAKYGSIALAR